MIIVSPLHQLEDGLARWRPSHVVSLSSPGGGHVALPADVETLRLTFHDIATPRDGLVMATEADVAALLTFDRTWSGVRPILVHCWAGVSRSPAVAYILACARSAPGGETILAERLREIAPYATPNAHLIALADRRLTRGGAMSRAIAAIGRGVEAHSGTLFTLDPP
jgi:predicted protein tyrosine phosphatase